MDQHAVPQDITGFKFKLVGDMTVKQFGELAGGAIVAYIFYIANWHPILKFPFVIFFALFGVALAFFPVQERPLDLWLVNFFKAIYHPTLYVWKRDKKTALVPAVPTDLPTLAKTSTDPLTGRPQVAFTPITVAQPNTAQVPITPHKELADAASTEEMTPPSSTTSARAPVIDLQQLMANRTSLSAAPASPSTPVVTTASVAMDSSPSPIAPASAPTVGKTQEELEAKATLSIDTLEKLRQEKLNEMELQKTQASGQTSSVSKASDTPPPTTAPRIMTIDALEKMRKSTSTEKDEQVASELSKNEALVNELMAHSKELLIQMDQIKNDLVLYGKITPEQQQKLDSLTDEKTKLATQITNIRAQITDQRVAPLTTAAYQQPIRPPNPDRKPFQVRVVDKVAKQAAPITLTEIPNVINGVVVDQNANPIDGTILIIKDKTGNSIRALKANKVGQFIGSTPLDNGTYYLELEKQNYTFDILEITLTGSVLPPLEIRPKVPLAAAAAGQTQGVVN